MLRTILKKGEPSYTPITKARGFTTNWIKAPGKIKAMKEELGQKASELLPALELLSGPKLEAKINKLAKISAGKCIGEGGSRLALSPEDIQARAILENWVQEAGMTVEKHPLGLIGTYTGSNPDLPAIGFGSHLDTVPAGGRYDGSLGIIGAIAVVQALKESGIKPLRSLKVFALTGEESSRFGIATFGSKGMCQGLTKETLNRKDKNSISMKQALVGCGFKPEQVEKPIISRNMLGAFIELHIQQEVGMAREGVQIGAVENIAAPVRFYAVFGKPQPEEKRFSPSMHTFLLQLTIPGEAGHSGALPMGARADGLVAAAHFISFLIEGNYPQILHKESLINEEQLKSLQSLSSVNKIMLGAVDVKGGAINKVPGETEMMIAIDGEESRQVGLHLQAALMAFLANFASTRPNFLVAPFKMEVIRRARINPEDYVFYPLSDVAESQKTAAGLVKEIEQATTKVGDKTVGTAGYMASWDNGQVVVAVDIRGIHRQSRGQVVKKVVDFVEKKSGRIEGKREEEPVTMNSTIVELIKGEAQNLGLTVEGLDSHAGHDAMSFALARIPTAMIFIPSRNGGVSHVPEEYSTAKDLANGVKVLAATVYRLAKGQYARN